MCDTQLLFIFSAASYNSKSRIDFVWRRPYWFQSMPKIMLEFSYNELQQYLWLCTYKEWADEKEFYKKTGHCGQCHFCDSCQKVRQLKDFDATHLTNVTHPVHTFPFEVQHHAVVPLLSFPCQDDVGNRTNIYRIRDEGTLNSQSFFAISDLLRVTS